MNFPTGEHPEDPLNNDANVASSNPPTHTNPSATDPTFRAWVRGGSPERPSAPSPRISSPRTIHIPPSTHNRPWLKRVLLTAEILALLLILTLLTTAIALRHAMHASLPENEGLLDGQYSVSGLSFPVTVTRDAQGVPSIHASTLDDLLFAQGFITASDRLFQMDALRRHGAGELAEILGPSLIQHDREQRILQLRSAADRAVAALPPAQLHQLQAYARGVNAFIDSHSAHGHSPSAQDLPIEFHILHYTPAPWTPRDSILIALVMAQDLSTEFPAKLDREALSAHLPANLLADLYPVGSWRDYPPTQDSTDLTTPSAPILQIPLDRTQSLNHDPAPANPRDLLTVDADLRAGRCDGCRSGSNNWAVSGAHTANGAPLLSNDMHLSLTAPDIWYEAGLYIDSLPAPTDPTLAVRAGSGLDVTGFTLPGVPFVIVGRNPFVAWSFTNSGADVQDVLIEHLRGHGLHTEYEHPDHTWAPVGHHIEHIHVRAGHDVTLDVLTTTHTIGATTIQTPIISPLYKTERRALALAWTIYDPSTITIPFLSVDSATDAASLVAAFVGFNVVSQNLVYADAHHIGYHLLGRIPIRGPAIQHPRAIQPFILPDATPSEGDQDESIDPQASLPQAKAILASFFPSPRRNSVLLTAAQPELPAGTLGPQRRRRNRRTPKHSTSSIPVSPSASASIAQLPTIPTTPYTIGSPISPVSVDALDPTQIWSGYIPYNQLPSVLDPASGILATANARIVSDNYPYFIANDWDDAYRIERINHLLQNRSGLTPADMLRIQTDVHSEFDLLIAHRLAYALDHSSLPRKDARLRQAADLLRRWNGDVSANSSAAAIVAATRSELWPMLLAPQFRAYAHPPLRPSPSAQNLDNLIDLYTWSEKTSALEQILQNTPARWLPHSFANWNDFLATAVQRGLHFAEAPGNLSTWTYGSIRPVDIAHPVFGSHSPISTLLGVATGSGFHPTGGDSTTIKVAGLHFGPSERFTADLANPDDTHANITTGESGNPSSRWFLDQFLPWLHGTTFTLPLDHPAISHSLTLTPN